jgi:hypothetical protein
METKVREFLKASVTERLFATASFFIMTLLLFMVAYFDPQRHSFFPKCWFYQLTGFACPGCGLTRAFHSLLNGNPLEAIRYNALLPIYVAFLIYVYVKLLRTIIRAESLILDFGNKEFYLLVGYLLISLSFGIIRNLPLYPFYYLFP